jgi:hypothetical protein
MSAPGGSTRSVRLSADQRRYLLSAGYLSADLRSAIAAKSADRTASEGIRFEMNHDLAERFRSAFTDRLAQAGFDRDYELTAEGAILEELIDAFFGETQ